MRRLDALSGGARIVELRDACGIAAGEPDRVLDFPLGILSAEEFTALLERFRQIDPAQNNEADPHLLVTAAAGLVASPSLTVYENPSAPMYPASGE